MVVSCPCSPGHQFTVYGHLYEGHTFPSFEATCNQGCANCRQQWYPVHAGSSTHTAFLEQVEAGEAVSCNGGFTCIKIGEWDDATAAKLAEQKVRVSLHTMYFFHCHCA